VAVLVPVLVVLLLAAVALLVLRPRDPVAAGPEVTSSASDPAVGDASGPAVGPLVEEPVSPTTEAPPEPTATPSETPFEEPSPDDPPEPFPTEVSVVRGSGGADCSSLETRSDYGDYPLARCTMWQRSEGLLHEEPLSKGAERVTCQRDLGRDNPTFKAGQTNTWWVWTTSDDGTWDWYPETAVSQGLSDQPINGIARCQDAS
jgi:hypothetical protein